MPVLMADIIRLVAVRAIKGQTWAGDAVFDSPGQPGSITVQGDRQPYIAVYVDEQDVVYEAGEGFPSSANSQEIQLVIEVAAAREHTTSAEAEPDQGDAPTTPTATRIENTDDGLELLTGFIAQQAIDALTSVSTRNPWGSIFAAMTAAGGPRKMHVRRGGPPGDQKMPQARLASRVVILVFGALSLPVRGHSFAEYGEAGDPWPDFLTALENDVLPDATPDEKAAQKAMSDLFRAHFIFESGTLSETDLARKIMGVSLASAQAAGIGPYPGRESPPLREVIFDAEPYEAPRVEVGGSEHGE